jgi:type I restriction enzyme S subunit
VRGSTTGKMNWADQQYCIGRGLAAIHPLHSELDTRLLYYFLKTMINELIKQTSGSTFPNLPSEKLREFSFPLAPLEEQRRVVNKIDELFSLADQIEKSVEEARTILSKIDMSILAKAFHGELVRQDPNDEPASILLKRINSERKKVKRLRIRR